MALLTHASFWRSLASFLPALSAALRAASEAAKATPDGADIGATRKPAHGRIANLRVLGLRRVIGSDRRSRGAADCWVYWAFSSTCATTAPI